MDVSLSRFTLLDWLYGDVVADSVFGLQNTIEKWTAVELVLARARHEQGLIPTNAFEHIENVVAPSEHDPRLHAKSLNVGYPIIALVELLNEQLPEEHRGHFHLGATTQDIMDTALVLQVREAIEIIEQHVTELGNLIAVLVKQHALTLMPGRTHAQIAVPTTFGLKMAVFLDQLGRSLIEMREAREQAAVISLHGAAGTSAALGEHAAAIRKRCAEMLDLVADETPWHVARDRFVRVAQASALLSSVLARLGREVVDLSRTEIAEVSEASGNLRGASSTMPQKRNPILSEAVIGLAVAAQASAALMLRAAEAGHERAAGEWQIEWRALPDTLTTISSACKTARELVAGLQVDVNQMRANLALDHGLVYAEDAMVGLARLIGRDRAHEIVYNAAQESRANGESLTLSLNKLLVSAGLTTTLAIEPGLDTTLITATCEQSVSAWHAIN